MISNSDIRARARDILGGGVFSNEWIYALLVVVCVGVLNGVLASTFVGPFILYGVIACASAAYFSSIASGSGGYKDLGVTLDSARGDLAGNLVTGLLYNVYIFLWTLLFIIPGIVKGCAYAMTFYIKNENPGMSASEAIRESEKMMEGYKMKYFLLQLSFIGWMIVGAFCFGIGTLWVGAYIETSRAVFYEELKSGARIY